MASFQILDEREENELHKSRLLNVEEKPFKRITKRLITFNAVTASRARQAPTPPPESANGTTEQAEATSPTETGSAADLSQVREDLTLDFAAFDSSIARLQFLAAANAAERARYSADRERILAASAAARDETTRLRAALAGARATLAQRRRFDELADRIAQNRLLRPRADQRANLAKLEEECAQLEAESGTYTETWHERREQFGRILEESMRLGRLIRDEKEEVERREGMDDEGGDGGGGGGAVDGADGGEGQTPRPGLASGNVTPRPDSGLLPGAAAVATKSGAAASDLRDGAGTPLPLSTGDGRTPARDSPGPDGDDMADGLKPPPDRMESVSQTGSRAASLEASLSRTDRDAEQDEQEETGDVEMEDASRPIGSPLGDDEHDNDETPRITLDSQDVVGEQMDTT